MNDNTTTYALKAYSIFENPDKLYNILYRKKNNILNYSIVEMLPNHTAKPIYDSKLGILTIANQGFAGRTCTQFFDTVSWHCKNGESYESCDKCIDCFALQSNSVNYECDGENDFPTGTFPTYIPPVFNYPPANGSVEGPPVVFYDPSGYVFDPNIEPNIDAAYVRASRAYSFWIQLNYNEQQWASQYPEIYTNLLENYLNKYSTANNSTNKDFHNWALSFFARNSDMTWEEFQNWTLNPQLSNGLLNELTADWENPNIVKPTAKFKNHAKINAIFNQAKTAANFRQYLENFEPTFSVAHLMFDIGNINNSNWLAYTSPPQNFWIKITFNKGKDWANTPKIVIAETFMHEIIHAEIYRKLLSLASVNGNIDTNAVTQQMLNHNYPGLFDYYVRYTKDNTDAQHNLMAGHYVSIMVNFLKQVYGTQYSDLVYKSIVWLDMKNTTAWNLLSQTERDLYQQTWDLNYWSWEK